MGIQRTLVRLNLIVIAGLIYFWRRGTPTRALVIKGVVAFVVINLLYPLINNAMRKKTSSEA